MKTLFVLLVPIVVLAGILAAAISLFPSSDFELPIVVEPILVRNLGEIPDEVAFKEGEPWREKELEDIEWALDQIRETAATDDEIAQWLLRTWKTTVVPAHYAVLVGRYEAAAPVGAIAGPDRFYVSRYVWTRDSVRVSLVAVFLEEAHHVCEGSPSGKIVGGFSSVVAEESPAKRYAIEFMQRMLAASSDDAVRRELAASITEMGGDVEGYESGEYRWLYEGSGPPTKKDR